MALSSTLATSVAVHEMASDDDLPRCQQARPHQPLHHPLGRICRWRERIRIPTTNPIQARRLDPLALCSGITAVVVVCNAHVAKRGAPLLVSSEAPLLMNEEGRADTGEISAARASVREATFM